jgi:[ribosomal protein S5]-alanine N-acetyltransferase
MFWSFWKTPSYEDVVLEGGRIELRPLLAKDAEDMFAYVSDPDVTHYLPWEPALSVDSVRPFLIEQTGRRRRGESVGFSIFWKATGTMIGSTDLMDLKVIKGQAELGYLLSKSYWGLGLMTEAARLTINFGFECLKLKTIIAWADEENIASRRVMEKLGMERSGEERRIVKGVVRPYVCYAINRAQWQGKVREEG